MTAFMPMFPTFLNAGATWDGTRPNDVFLRNREINCDQIATSNSADTLSRLLDLLDENGEDDYGMVSPTQHAFKSAFKLIRDAQRQMGGVRIVGSASVDSVGGIRVAWNREDREIRLVCPASQPSQVYIYQQSESRNRAIHGVSPEVLAHKLSWLISGGDIL
jgi:hypothetical protein